MNSSTPNSPTPGPEWASSFESANQSSQEAPHNPQDALEVREQTHETQASTGNDSDATQPIVLPQVAPTTVMGVSADDSAQAQGTPQIADDVDVIEIEWINRAKEIINRTSNDPHSQEQEIDKLHQAYLQKRYGRTLKSPDDK